MTISHYSSHALVALCLVAAAFYLADMRVGRDSSVARSAIGIDFLSPRANGLLSACAQGELQSCDRARRHAEIANDSVYSRINVACRAGQTLYCDLRKGLVDAELRKHENRNTG
ncbi:hypothetical protein [Oceaniglobus indicus]|uniref:hypothetical protein n=1 Tax=Oceaniglobus indicus TaxID=2047749 RepID=UPI000C17DC98|nr:hypothetical protein [Oceaniglobus indicus]